MDLITLLVELRQHLVPKYCFLIGKSSIGGIKLLVFLATNELGSRGRGKFVNYL
jgi:hypothetical protein